MNKGARGQSELTSVLLVVAVGVVLAGGVFVSLDLDPTTPAPQASVSVDADGDRLQVTHTDGDVFGTDEAVVLVRVGDREERYSLSSFTGGDGDDEFGGESLVRQTSLGGDADVLLIHEPSNAVLSESTVTLGLPGTGVDFSTSRTSSLDINRRADGSTVTVTDGGRSVSMTGNDWEVVEFPTTITDDSVLTFEFKSTDEGEIHGIGFYGANDVSGDQITQSGLQTYQVYGSQPWGNRSPESYSAGDGWKRYEIPLGGNRPLPDRVEYLVFVNDDDGGGSATVNSQFRDVRVYNASG